MKKKIVCLLLTLVMVLGLCACGAGDSKGSADGLKVGFGRESIIPDGDVQLAGGDASSRISQGYIDEVAVTCIAITEGDNTVLLYTTDVIVVDKHVLAAQDAIASATGIPKENIILNATHTHSGVSIRSDWDGVDAYRTLFNKAAADAGVAALADQSAAELYYGSADTENLVFVRHYLLENGTTAGNGHGDFSASSIKSHAYEADDELQVIKFARAAEDKKDIVLMSLGAHGTIVNGTNRESISADWPGTARAYVEANSDSLAAVFEGAAGDQIPDSKIPGMCPLGKDHRKYGEAVGKYAVDTLSNMTKAEGTGVNLVQQNYTADSMKEGLERLADALEVAKISGQYGTSHVNTTAAVVQYGFYNVYEATGIVSRSKTPATLSMDLHTLTVDGVSFIFAPYEMFGEQGRYIKDNSPYGMTFIVTCSESSQGHMGYMPNLYGCEESFYEYDVTKFARGTAENLAETYVKILTDMQQAG